MALISFRSSHRCWLPYMYDSSLILSIVRNTLYTTERGFSHNTSMIYMCVCTLTCVHVCHLCMTSNLRIFKYLSAVARLLTVGFQLGSIKVGIPLSFSHPQANRIVFVVVV